MGEDTPIEKDGPKVWGCQRPDEARGAGSFYRCFHARVRLFGLVAAEVTPVSWWRGKLTI